MTGSENPFFEYYDDVLEILREYDVTISLGDALRPGCLADSSDAGQLCELIELGYLTKRAWEKDVQVMVEGPGHMAMDEIAANMKLQKRLCHNAPFYVLGPLVTDIAPGYDHITAAIGGAIAAASGADFLCYVTPAEHLRLPDLNDVKEGIAASKIAAHAADIAKGVPHARERDDRMAQARHKLDWEEMFGIALDGEKARAYFESTPPQDRHTSVSYTHLALFSLGAGTAKGKHLYFLSGKSGWGKFSISITANALHAEKTAEQATRYTEAAAHPSRQTCITGKMSLSYHVSAFRSAASVLWKAGFTCSTQASPLL